MMANAIDVSYLSSGFFNTCSGPIILLHKHQDLLKNFGTVLCKKIHSQKLCLYYQG